MNKLYAKNEVTFAIVWIVTYIVSTSIADSISKSLGLIKSVTLLLHILMIVFLYAWLKKNNLFKKYDLRKSEIPASKFLYFIPLIIISTCNVWFGVRLNMSVLESLFYVGSMICVGFLEELIFRGFLFKAMCKDGVKSAIIVTSITFGIGHIVNLFNGSGAELIPNLCQVCYAIAFGFLFAILVHRGKSLIPCIVSHATINSLSAFANVTNQTQGMRIGVSIILTVVALGYALALLKTLPKNDESVSV